MALSSGRQPLHAPASSSPGCLWQLLRDVELLGMSLGTVMSWHAYQSIPWAIVHGLCGWVYVLYVVVTR